jgi:sensor domain CHASE-containing protein
VNQLDPQITAGLVSLALVVIGGIGTLVKVLIDRIAAENQRIARKVDENTAITQKVEKQTNGELARARNLAQRLQLERDAYRDMVRFVNARPDGRAILTEYADRRRVRVRDAELDALLSAATPSTEAPQ